jgi:hypothetical protein
MFSTLFYLSIAGCAIGSVSHGSAKTDARGDGVLTALPAIW